MALGFSVQNAVKYGKIERISEWVDTHPDSNDLSHFLLVAAEDATESTEVVELLIGAGADPNFTIEVDGFVSGPPLSGAAHRSSLNVVKCLVELGADVNYCAPHRFNALNSAVYNPTGALYKIVEYLISLGIDLDIESK